MGLTKEQLIQEKNYLEKVKNIINNIICSMSTDLDNEKSSITSMKRFMWENISEYTDLERATSLYDMDQIVDMTNNKIQQLENYKKALKSPYFGKVTFVEDGEQPLDIYIGITSVDENLDFYVFDWRSPISSLFYNYEIGKAKYDCPAGEINGEITDKMQYKIVDGELLRCFQSNINIDDEYLQEILANASNEKMKNIVSTIQREQNLIIRNERDKYLVVQGIAGSGKTSVALHRIAYLLYREQNLNYNNILIMSPNDIFSEYISDVLPELGEENVLKTTYSEFASSFLKIKKIESYSDFLERIYTDFKYDELLEYKMSDTFIDKLEQFLIQYNNKVLFTKKLEEKGILISPGELQEMFSDKFQKLPYMERIDSIASELCYRLNLPTSKFSSKIKNNLISINSIDFDPFKIYNEFLSLESLPTLDNKNLNYEDIVPILTIYFKTYGVPNYGSIRQVVIDEVQDYSISQLQLLKRIFKNASFTLLGDVNQSLNPYYKYDTLKTLDQIFNNSKYVELVKTYRSSQEIIEYSNSILNINNACSVRHNVNVPVISGDLDDANILKILNNDIMKKKSSGMKRIAIITKDVADAKKIYKMFDNEIQLVLNSFDIINKDIIIIPSYLAKGLEFDAVVLYNSPDNRYTEYESNLYYVACTRAQHQLSVYNAPILKLAKSK